MPTNKERSRTTPHKVQLDVDTDSTLPAEIEAVLPEIAHRYFVLRESIDCIYKAFQSESAAPLPNLSKDKIKLALTVIEKRKLVSIALMTRTGTDIVLRELERQLKDRFDVLQEVRIVWGRSGGDINEPGSGTDASESAGGQTAWTVDDRITWEMGKVAGAYLSERLQETNRYRKVSKVVVGPGRAVAATINHTRLQIPRPDISVMPWAGSLGLRRFNASPLSNARQLENVTAGSLYVFPAPAIISVPDDPETESRLFQDLTHLPIIARILEKINGCDLILTSLTGRPKVDEWDDLLSRQALSAYYKLEREEKVCGAISGLVFDYNGRSVAGLPWHFVGGSTSLLSERIQARKDVVVVAGADMERVAPLLALLKAECISVLITDSVTALALLNASGSKVTIDQSLGPQYHFAHRSTTEELG